MLYAVYAAYLLQNITRLVAFASHLPKSFFLAWVSVTRSTKLHLKAWETLTTHGSGCRNSSSLELPQKLETTFLHQGMTFPMMPFYRRSTVWHLLVCASIQQKISKCVHFLRGDDPQSVSKDHANYVAKLEVGRLSRNQNRATCFCFSSLQAFSIAAMVGIHVSVAPSACSCSLGQVM